jgi:hypothetical protein
MVSERVRGPDGGWYYLATIKDVPCGYCWASRGEPCSTDDMSRGHEIAGGRDAQRARTLRMAQDPDSTLWYHVERYQRALRRGIVARNWVTGMRKVTYLHVGWQQHLGERTEENGNTHVEDI